MTAELCYIGKTGTHRVPSVSKRLLEIATFVGKGLVYHDLAIVSVYLGNETTARYIVSAIPNNTNFGEWENNLEYRLIAGYNTDERLAFCIGSKVYYLVDLPVGQVYVHFGFQVIYDINISTHQAGPSSHITVIGTASEIRVNLQYLNQPVIMRKTWYCRLSVYSTYNEKEVLVHDTSVVTVSASATYCTIPKIAVNTGEHTGTTSELPIKLYLKYSFDKSNWTSILLHTFSSTTTNYIACVDKTVNKYYLLETIYE